LYFLGEINAAGNPVYAILDILAARGIKAESLLYQTTENYMQRCTEIDPVSFYERVP